MLPAGAGAVLAAPLPQPPWGTLVATYFVVIGIPTGLTLVTAYATSDAQAERRTGLERWCTWTALVVLVLASLLLVADLHRPARFFLMLTEFGNLASPISLGAKLIAVKTFLLVVALLVLNRQRGTGGTPAPGLTRVVVRVLATSLLVVSAVLALYPAAVLAGTWTSPLARTGGAFLMFLVTALVMGAAVVLLLAGRGGDRPEEPGERVRRAVPPLVAIYAAALLLEAWAVRADPTIPDGALDEVLGGRYAGVFWGGVVATGVAVALLQSPAPASTRVGRVIAACLLLAGAAVTRYLFVAVGP